MPPRSKKVKSKPRPRWMLSLKYERTAATTALKKRLRAAAKAHGFVRAGRVNLTGYAKWVLQNAVRQWEGMSGVTPTVTVMGVDGTFVPLPMQWNAGLGPTPIRSTNSEPSTPEE